MKGKIASFGEIFLEIKKYSDIPSIFLYYSAFGRAKDTEIVRPSIMVPSRASMAAVAPASSAYSTNPNPRLRPVSRSVITRAETTDP